MIRFLLLLVMLSSLVFGQQTVKEEKSEETTTESSPHQTETPLLTDLVMTVVGTRTERSLLNTPGSITVLNAEDMNREGMFDFGDLVKREPLVSAPFQLIGSDGFIPYNNGGHLSYNIRGMESNRVLLAIDGIRQPDEFRFGGSEPVSRDYFDPAILGALEILKGPGSSLYGSDALGGAFSLRTANPAAILPTGDKQSFNLRSSYNGADSGLSNLFSSAFRGDKLSASLVYSRREGNETENNSDINADPTDYDSDSILGKLIFDGAPGQRWTVTAEYFKRDTRYDVDSLETSTLYDFPGFYFFSDTEAVINTNERDRYRFSVAHDYTPENGITAFDHFRTFVYYQETESADFNTTDQSISNLPDNSDLFTRLRTTDTAYNTEIYGVTLQADKHFTSGNATHRLVYGLEASSSYAEKPFVRTETTPTYQTVRDSPHMAPSDTLRAGLFVQDEISLANDRWLLIPGVRIEHYEVSPENTPEYLYYNSDIEAPEFDQTSVSPKLSAMYRPSRNWNLYLQYSHGFRNPNAEELTATFIHPPPATSQTIPNPELKEETSHAYEIGSKGDFGGFSYQVAGFLTDYDNFIEQFVPAGQILSDPDNPNSTPIDLIQAQNVGKAEIYGFELNTLFSLGHYVSAMEGFELGFSTGYAVGKDKENDTWLESTEPRKSVVSFAYRAAEDRFGTRLTGTFVAKKSKTAAEIVPPSYTDLDLIGWYRITDHVSLNAGVNNLLDEEYWLWSSYRQGGHSSSDGILNPRFTQPGLHGFFSVNLNF